MKIFFVILTLLSVLQVETAFSKDIPPRPATADPFLCFIDESALIDPKSSSEIQRLCSEHAHLTGDEIVITVFKSADGEKVDDYSNRIFESWKLGQFKKNNGILLTVFLKEKTAHLAVGFAFDTLYSTNKKKPLLSSTLFPQLEVGNTGPGILIALNEILKQLESPLSQLNLKTDAQIGTLATSSQVGKALVLFLFIFAFIGLAVILFALDFIVASESVFHREGWQRINIFTGWFTKNLKRGGGTHGQW